jgi:hypothetical protein
VGERSVSATDRVEVGDQVFFRELDGETVLLNIDTGQYYGLDEVGTRVFLLLREHQALDKVLNILEAEYDVPPDKLRTDVIGLMERLSAHGLLKIANRDA